MVNIGSVDRSIRFVAGILLIALLFLPSTAPWFAALGNWKWGVFAVGVIMIGTAVIRFCPAYTLFGVTTCSRK